MTQLKSVSKVYNSTMTMKTASTALITAYFVVASFSYSPVRCAEKIQPNFDNLTTTLHCPPGFVPQSNSCVCADWPSGMITCDELSKTASMQIGYCMTYDNERGEVRAGACPQSNYQKDFHGFYYPLPTEISNLTDYMCSQFHSEGLLCGKCKDDFSAPPLYYIVNFQCVNCNSTSYGWFRFLVVSHIPNTILLTLVVIFSISTVSGPVNAFIYFSQITTDYYSISAIQNVLRAQGGATYSNTVTQIFSGFYLLFNSDFFPSLIRSFCLVKHLSIFQATALKYVAAIIPLLFILVLYVCIQLHAHNFRLLVWCWKPFHKHMVKVRKSVDLKTSVIDAFATFILLSYAKILAVSHFLLKPANLYDGYGEKVRTVVAYYDGSINYFHKEHLPFAIPAVVIPILLAILPVLLLLYPISALQKCLTRCKMNSQALRAFIETFQGCFKDGTDGTKDCRYFAGLYFLLRIISLLLSFASIEVYIATSALLYQFIAVLVAVIQPYRRHFNNIVDPTIFTILGAVYSLSLCHVVIIFLRGETSPALLYAVDVLFTLPLLYLILYLTCWVISRKTNCYQRLKISRLLQSCFSHGAREDFDAATPHRLLHPGEYEVYQMKEYKEPVKEHNASVYGSI